ncbi:helix-turn-helix transcriptional regulator [Sphingobium rhizovicinum]|uniref:Helix-turn-helix transcriptional regulator n=1 Tax=Sphingobium rhizovicinum TaxID=432308 RepID=A0ABV7NJX7_9SPHN
MSTKTTGEILGELRDRSGMTLSEIARAAGYKGPSSVQMMFSPDYSVNPLNASIAERLAKAMVGKGAPPIRVEELFALSQPQAWTHTQYINWAREQKDEPRVIPTTDPKPPTAAQIMSHETDLSDVPRGMAAFMARDIEVFGSALAADIEFDDKGNAAFVEQTLFEMGEVITYARRPPGVSLNAKIYALYVSGSSMEPRYRPGDPLFVDTRRPPAIGDDVVVQLVNSDEEPHISTGLIKTLVRRTGSHLELEQYRPEIRFSVPMERVAHIHRVIPTKELFGI